MDLSERIAPLCVYTIAHSDRLNFFYNLGGRGELTEGKRWVRAATLLKAAGHFRLRFLVLFAGAEQPKELIYYAELDSIRLPDSAGDGGHTEYSFSRLTPFKKPHPLKTSLINDVTQKPIPSGYIRPYLICRTPASLLISDPFAS